MIYQIKDKKMKIAFIFDMIYPFNIGGVEVRNYEIAKRLVKKGHEVHLYGGKFWKGKDIIKIEGIIIHGVYRYHKPKRGMRERRLIEPIIFAIKLYKKLKKQRFDIIECSTAIPFPCFSCYFISKSKKIPLVFTWHQYFGDYFFYYFDNIKAIIAYSLEKITLKLTKNNIAVSKFTKKDLIKNKIRGDVFVNFNGIDIKKINSIKKQKQKFDLIFVGRLIYQKNIELLINSIKFLKKDFPNISVGIVGKGPDEKKLKKLTKRLRLNDNISFLGEIKPLQKTYELMRSSKVFVLPSRLEGFGIVVIEANACGLPVIVTNSKWNASKELIKKDYNGIISKNTPKELAKNIKKLLENKKLLNKMKKNAKEYAQNFDWDIITDKLKEHYYSVLKNK